MVEANKNLLSTTLPLPQNIWILISPPTNPMWLGGRCVSISVSLFISVFLHLFSHPCLSDRLRAQAPLADTEALKIDDSFV